MKTLAGHLVAITLVALLFGAQSNGGTVRNLTHFDIEIGGALYPAAEEPLLLDPLLSPYAYLLGGCLVRDLHGFKVSDALLLLDNGDPRIIVPRLAPAIALAEAADLEPFTIPLRLIGDRGRPGPVVLASEDDLETAPGWLAVDYLGSYPERARRLGPIARVIKGTFPVRVRGGVTISPVPDEQAAFDRQHGDAHCPEVPADAAAVLVPHSGPIVREYARRGHVVLVTSTVGQDGTVDLYRVA